MATRILLKLSGEILSGKKGFGIQTETLNQIVSEIIEVKNQGYEIGIVIGGGNIFRGSKLIEEMDFPPYKAHHMGMVGTVINGLALETVFRKKGIKAKNYSSFNIEGISTRYNVEKARKEILDKILIFTGGTGNPFFSTDTAASLRAVEMNADFLLKATKVDGVFSSDPVKNDNAKFYPEISYEEYINQNLKVMDHSAVLMCKENKIPIFIFNILKKGNLNLVLKKKSTYTLIK